ncbi:MAG: sulfatase [Bacteroides sp.]
MAKDKKSMNVLFLMADDLRPELGCYGVKEVCTPNIDRLASSGVLFQNAYCNVPVSGASRASLLTGMYPRHPRRFVAFDAWASKDAPQAVPVSRWFTTHGYHTLSNGKVFHNLTDHADSWSEPPWRVHPDGYGADWAVYNKWELWMNDASGRTIHPRSMRGPFCESADVPDSAYDDGKATLRTINDLRRLKACGKPFFLACGFWRPHLPFNAPKKYWDLYRRSDIPLASNRYLPHGLPPQVRASQEIVSYARVSDTNEDDFQREAKHGYYASISYVDAQIGQILQALDDLGLAENTIVVLLGDHGWHLGEHTFWGKHNLMDRATHVPLIIRVPGKKRGKTRSMVEFVDLYPTLCELCNLPKPENQLDGTSFVPIFANLRTTVKEKVYIQWDGGDNAVDSRYSYAEWNQKDGTANRMLFDHRKDAGENNNRANEKAYQKVNHHFSSFLRELKIKNDQQ